MLTRIIVCDHRAQARDRLQAEPLFPPRGREFLHLPGLVGLFSQGSHLSLHWVFPLHHTRRTEHGTGSCSCFSLWGWMAHSPPESSKPSPPLHPGPGVQNRAQDQTTVSTSVTMQRPTCFIFFLISVVTLINLFSSSQYVYNIKS